MPSAPSLRRAAPEDAGGLLELMRAYYAEDAYPFDEVRSPAALMALLEDDRLGEVWLAAEGELPLGYVVICFGWSLEYRGRDAFVDEVFVERSARGRGLGRALVDHAIRRCRALGVRALHLEVERSKERTQALYRSLGFRDNDRRLMTLRLA
ncbi:MAG TPA: GNAT family N-acetyltransferase [Vicinamibacteria bacterium]|nr:GNAT family N-acetyltransferase [Vicinamibacteria bacterium]